MPTEKIEHIKRLRALMPVRGLQVGRIDAIEAASEALNAAPACIDILLDEIKELELRGTSGFCCYCGNTVIEYEGVHNPTLGLSLIAAHDSKCEANPLVKANHQLRDLLASVYDDAIKIAESWDSPSNGNHARNVAEEIEAPKKRKTYFAVIRREVKQSGAEKDIVTIVLGSKNGL